MASSTETPTTDAPSPSVFRWILGFLLVGMAWGLTTPFIRRAAIHFRPSPHPSLENPSNSWLKKKILKGIFTVIDLLRSPAYALPLLINLTGSVWFFLLIGQAGKRATRSELGKTSGVNLLTLTLCRAKSYGTDHKLPGIFVHCPG